MLPTHLPLYGQLPVLRQAEGEFAEDPEREGEHSPALRHTPRARSQTRAHHCCPGAHNRTSPPEKNTQLKGWGSPGDHLLALTAQHQLSTFPSFSLGLPILPVPGWRRSSKT